MKFKTTIKCSGCLANVTPALNSIAGEDNWEVDIQTPEKLLTISSDDELSETAVINAIETAGYKAERLN